MTLKERIWFTIIVLIVVRIGTYVPVPGFNPVVLGEVFQAYGSSILGGFDLISGGAFGRMSIFALGIMPYVTCAICLQLVTAVSPRLKALETAGAAGHKTVHQYVRYGTLLLCIFQSYGLVVGLETLMGWSGVVVIEPGLQFRVTTAMTLTAGGLLLMWLCEQINDRGIGNGAMLIFAVGVVADLASALVGMSWLADSIGLAVISIVIAITVGSFMAFAERASRKVLVDQWFRPRSGRTRRGALSFLRLKVNAAGSNLAKAALALLRRLALRPRLLHSSGHERSAL
jgi:preprotein translocase subunit SecY